MATGKVKWFDPRKGFGFIIPDEKGTDIFVHQSGLADGIDSLEEGQAVEFETESTPRGPKAVSVRPV